MRHAATRYGESSQMGAGTLQKEDPGRLKPAQAYGYGVDSGMGCFMDVEAARVLLPNIERFDSAIGSLGPPANVVVDPGGT